MATLPSTTALQMGSGVFDVNGGSQQVASVSDYSGGGGSIINSNTAAMAVLTISPTGTTTNYSGSILSGGTNGAITLVLDGNGTQILSGDNTYSGGTFVEAGTLILNDSAALPDGSSLTVGAGGTFIFDPSVAGSPAIGLSRDSLAPSTAGVLRFPNRERWRFRSRGCSWDLVSGGEGREKQRARSRERQLTTAHYPLNTTFGCCGSQIAVKRILTFAGPPEPARVGYAQPRHPRIPQAWICRGSRSFFLIGCMAASKVTVFSLCNGRLTNLRRSPYRMPLA